MNVSVTKLELIDLLLKTNDNLVLDKVRVVLENKEEQIVSFTANGKALTEIDYNKKLEKAALDFQNGNFISSESLKMKYNIV